MVVTTSGNTERTDVARAAWSGGPPPGAAGGRAGVRADPARLRDPDLQLRLPDRRRPRARRGPHAGGLRPRLPGPPAVLAALQVHHLALPGDEEPRPRRAPCARAPSPFGRRDRGRAAARGRRSPRGAAR